MFRSLRLKAKILALTAGCTLFALLSQAQMGQTPGATLTIQNANRQLDNVGVVPLVQNYLMYWSAQLAVSDDPFDKVTAGFYTANGGMALWHNGQDWSPGARGAFQALAEANLVGLDRSVYLGGRPFSLTQATQPSDIARIDTMLTRGVLAYALDARFGRGHEIAPTQSIPLMLEVQKTTSEAQAFQYMMAMNPQTRLFWAMREAMAEEGIELGKWRQIAVNMHRQRTEAFIPHPGKQLVVDLGLQHLIAYEDNQPLFDMAVVIGKPKRRTPILTDKIVSLKFSPDWTVPNRIVQEDLVPIMAEDPSIVADLDFSVRTWGGKPIDMNSINWNQYLDGNFPYTFYQKPGMNNLLGGVRFSLTNDQNIYMHDSPDVNAFSDGLRTGSSGCVRVGDATAIAWWIMSDEQGWSETDVVRAMVSGQTRNVGLKEPVLVRFIYSTAMLNGQGQLVLMPDIYGDDLALATAVGI